MTKHPTVLTIGHSTHPFDSFINLLRQHDVSAVADVRSAPYSRYNQQYNKNTLSRSLRDNGISYVFLGRELGARSNDPSCYVNGRVRYARLAERQEFRKGIERVITGSEVQRIALMCAEREPLDCHRTLLVSEALEMEGLTVEHIHFDGHLETHKDAMERLLDVVGLPHDDLFRSKKELMAEAQARQEERIAYKEENLTAEETGKAR